MLLLVVVDVVIFVLLARFNGPLAILFLIAAVVSIPALVIYRRDEAAAQEIGPESESTRRGWLRLIGVLGLDLTGVVLAVLIIVAAVLVLRSLGTAGLHG
jgi:hypothetical protein